MSTTNETPADNETRAAHDPATSSDAASTTTSGPPAPFTIRRKRPPFLERFAQSWFPGLITAGGVCALGFYTLYTANFVTAVDPDAPVDLQRIQASHQVYERTIRLGALTWLEFGLALLAIQVAIVTARAYAKHRKAKKAAAATAVTHPNYSS
ncbi:MAG: hypothetical protein KGM43_03925 [Planctomycetota bacterium]|nr:hypothetical protein [Planctomycetota bacterium]